MLRSHKGICPHSLIGANNTQPDFINGDYDIHWLETFLGGT